MSTFGHEVAVSARPRGTSDRKDRKERAKFSGSLDLMHLSPCCQSTYAVTALRSGLAIRPQIPFPVDFPPQTLQECNG
jgi:hypothetical protein